MNDFAIDGCRCIYYKILTSEFCRDLRCFWDCMNVMDGLEKALCPAAESVSKNIFLLCTTQFRHVSCQSLSSDQCLRRRRTRQSPQAIWGHNDSGQVAFLAIGYSFCVPFLLWRYFCRSEIGYNLSDQLLAWKTGEFLPPAAWSRFYIGLFWCPRQPSFCLFVLSSLFLVESIPLAWTMCVFVAIIVGFLSVHIFDLVIKKNCH